MPPSPRSKALAAGTDRGIGDGPALGTLEFVSPTAAEIARPPARAARNVSLILAGLFAGAVALAALLPIERVVSAPGRLVGTVPNILVQPLEPAILRSFNVRLNQVVRQGEVIARLDPTFAVADLAALQGQENGVAAEVARLEAEAADRAYGGGSSPAEALQAAIFAQRQSERNFRIESFNQRIRSLQEQSQRGTAELAQLQQRAAIAGQIEGMRRELERVQIGSRLNSLLATDGRLEIQRAIANTEGLIRSGSRDLAGLQAELDAYLGQWRTQVSQDLALKRRDLSDVRENVTKAQLRRDLIEMRAPMDAVVLEAGNTALGAVLAAGETLVTLVPLHARLEVDAQIVPRDVGFVGIGDRVAIKFETFPYIRHGTARGVVTSLGEDTARARDSAPGTPPYYRSRIAIEELALRNLPADFRLVPGMPVQADIIVGRRTPLRYFFERAIPTLTEGLREP